ncbi:MAG TPA: protein-methionine-sulfoxide reductase catalytic subunit MsrP [Edaphobacter sp.]|jgi:sulfoxide reductase catalytic subunit YedY|nr:protein-methionine-sulfoxide reductase catalytic subunit MsrP [Edaphobacter sp.]
MLLRKSVSLESTIPSSDITPEPVFEQHQKDRRRFLTGAATVGAGALATAWIRGLVDPATSVHAADQLQAVASKYTLSDAETPLAKASNYNNFYEFGTDKSDPAHNAYRMHTHPWPIQITGMVKKPQTINIDDLVHYRPLESRVYRHRCVEAWSMVIPWDGYSLSEFINFCEPLPSAKYIQFFSVIDKKAMDLPFGYDWPYKEGLRMDEAMNPLTLLTFGCYGQTLPNQNGAPVRVIVPWKYGFKSAKSIVRFHFTDKQPVTTWNQTDGQEYGFYSNVNPNYDNARWSQAHERRIDSSIIPRTIPTLMFNGYGDQVASMYAGMDLKKYY